MAVKRYRRKPLNVGNEDQHAALYTPGESLADLRTVAMMCHAEITEVTMPGGTRVLLARWLDIPDEHPARNAWVTVEAGRYLAYSGGTGFLYETDDGDWRQWYDLVSEGGVQP